MVSLRSSLALGAERNAVPARLPVEFRLAWARTDQRRAPQGPDAQPLLRGVLDVRPDLCARRRRSRLRTKAVRLRSWGQPVPRHSRRRRQAVVELCEPSATSTGHVAQDPHGDVASSPLAGLRRRRSPTAETAVPFTSWINVVKSKPPDPAVLPAIHRHDRPPVRPEAAVTKPARGAGAPHG